MFEPCLAAVARRGRQVAISSGGMPRVTFSLVDFYHNESRLIGVDSLKWSFAETAQVLRDLVPVFETGGLPPPEVQTAPFEHGPEGSTGKSMPAKSAARWFSRHREFWTGFFRLTFASGPPWGVQGTLCSSFRFSS